MQNVKVKIFEKPTSKKLEDALNQFICEDLEECEVVDIKFHVDDQSDTESTAIPMYVALLMYI